MINSKTLLIYLSPSSLYQCVYEFVRDTEQNKTNCQILEASLMDLCDLYSCKEYITSRDQVEILNILRQWQKEYSTENYKVELILSSNFRELLPSELFIQDIENIFGVEVKEFSSTEYAYQSCLSLREFASVQSDKQIIYFNFSQNNILALTNVGDFTETFVNNSAGIEKISQFIQNSLKNNNYKQSFQDYINGQLIPLVNSLQLAMHQESNILLDENMSRLLLNVLEKDIQTQSINASEIIEIAEGMINDEFSSLKHKEIIEEDNFFQSAAQIIILKFLIEKLNIKSVIVSPEQRIKGYLCQKALGNNITLSSLDSYSNQWKKSAQLLNIQIDSLNFNNSLHTVKLTEDIYLSGRDIVHSFDYADFRVLYVAGLFFEVFRNKSKVQVYAELEKVLGLSKQDMNLIYVLIKFVAEDSMYERSKYLDLIPVKDRLKVRQLTSVLKLAQSLNITKQQAIGQITIQQSTEGNNILFYVQPRANISTEMSRFEQDKKDFEVNFSKSLEMKV